MDVKVSLADGSKCPRCWKWHYCRLNPEGLCDRCCDVLLTLDDALDLGECTLGELKARILQSRKEQAAWCT